MSRSHRKTPIFGNTTTSTEKQYKRYANRAHRQKVKAMLLAETKAIRRRILRRYCGEPYLPLKREMSNVWAWGKDGKGYWLDATEKDMRK